MLPLRNIAGYASCQHGYMVRLSIPLVGGMYQEVANGVALTNHVGVYIPAHVLFLHIEVR